MGVQGVVLRLRVENPDEILEIRESWPYHYYICAWRVELSGMCSCTQKAITAADAEEAVWVVSGLLRDPEGIRRGMDRLMDEERAAANRRIPRAPPQRGAD